MAMMIAHWPRVFALLIEENKASRKGAKLAKRTNQHGVSRVSA